MKSCSTADSRGPVEQENDYGDYAELPQCQLILLWAVSLSPRLEVCVRVCAAMRVCLHMCVCVRLYLLCYTCEIQIS